jgi:sialate O-acetylesterase
MATWNAERTYTVPAKLATAGRHVIAIRVVDTGGGGGVFGAPEQLSLSAAGGAKTSLAGTWRYRIAEEIPERAGPPMGPGNPWLPTSLRNGMITPLIPFAIRGAIWYQGESNAGGAWQYRTLFPAMIGDWRAAWKQGDFPFLFVQLANFTQPPAQPGDNEWAELRDAQFNTLRTLKATGMASAIDIGEAADIHPKNKQDVGRRLARWALADTYGKQIEASGPLYTGAKVENGRIRVGFDHLGGGLEAKGGALTQFAIAGEDKKWVWAEAAIDGDTVVVSSAAVAKPLAVRYAWSANPAGCNLYNKAGLPASPFRTDDWPAITDRK